MSEEYKDYIAISVLVIFLGALLIVLLSAVGWFVLVILGMIGAIGLLTWALDRVADF